MTLKQAKLLSLKEALHVRVSGLMLCYCGCMPTADGSKSTCDRAMAGSQQPHTTVLLVPTPPWMGRVHPSSIYRGGTSEVPQYSIRLGWPELGVQTQGRFWSLHLPGQANSIHTL